MAKLFTEIKIGNNTFKNRIFMSPMCMYNCQNEDGILTKEHYDHYTARAFGGVGAIVVEATMVNAEGGISRKDLGLYNDNQMLAFKELTSSIHYYNCKIGIQLSHAGRKAVGYETIYAPSAISFSEQGQIPKQLTVEQIKNIVNDFIKAGIRAEQAGFDFIELHVAHGYLLSQFISPLANKRNDEYGGSLEKRYKILGEIIRGIKGNTSLDIHIRISADEVEEDGNTLEDIAQVLKWAESDGVVFNDISSGGITEVPPRSIFPGYQAILATKLKEKGLRVGAVGILDEPALCEYLIASGDVEVVYLGRTLLKNPFWAMNAAKELHEKYEPNLISYHRAFGFKRSKK